MQARFDALMPPGMAPLVLFRVLARDLRLFQRFMGAGLLDKGHLTLRQREIVIHRVTARCGSEYEWGVHAAIFAERAGLDAEQLRSIVHGGPADACWSPEDALIVRFCDALHADCTVGDALWADARRRLQRGGHPGAAAARRLLPHRLVSDERAPPAARALRRPLVAAPPAMAPP